MYTGGPPPLPVAPGDQAPFQRSVVKCMGAPSRRLFFLLSPGTPPAPPAEYPETPERMDSSEFVELISEPPDSFVPGRSQMPEPTLLLTLLLRLP